MKKLKFFLIVTMLISMCSCTKKEPYQQIEICMDELKEKIENKESFKFMVIRDQCDFCQALKNYIDLTSQEHDGVILYTIDSTDFGFKREKEEDLLTSDTEDGQALLNLCPYFLYTPSIYTVEEGKIVTSGIGFDDLSKSVSVWDLDSFVDFNEAQQVEFWDFIS